MKRILQLIAIAMLVSCTARTEDTSKTAKDPAVYVDRATGCHYLASRAGEALTPRIATDGRTHVCQLKDQLPGVILGGR